MLLEAAVSDFSETAEEDGPGKSIAGLAFVEAGVNAAAEVDALRPRQDKQVRSMRPSSRSATAGPLRRGYPRLNARLSHEDLDARYTLNEVDQAFIRASMRGEWGRLTLAMLLKTRQDFGFFPVLEEMPLDMVTHLASQLGLIAPAWPGEALGTKTLYRYQSAVRAYLRSHPREPQLSNR